MTSDPAVGTPTPSRPRAARRTSKKERPARQARPDRAARLERWSRSAPPSGSSRLTRSETRGLVRPAVTWSIVAVLLAVAAVAAIGGLNNTVYSAGSTVRQYLAALARHDAAAALQIPGVDVSEASPGGAHSAPEGTDASGVLLRDGMTSDIRDIEIISDLPTEAGVREVTAGYELAGKAHRSTFTLAPGEARFGVFHSWRFAESPVAVVSLAVLHETVVDVNGLAIDIRSSHAGQTGFGARGDFLVFAPGAYTFSHESRLLTAEPVTAVVTEPGQSAAVEVDAAANDVFVSSVQKELDSYLDDCASQQVLLPAGCPFGQFIENRLLGLPKWSIKSYPPVSLSPTDTGWEMSETEGSAHLAGEVQSLFDGTISELDEKVPFTVALTASIRPDGSLDIRLQ